MREHGGGTQKIDLLKTQGRQENINPSGTYFEDLDKHTDQDYGGQKIGRKGNGLDRFLETREKAMVYTNSQDNGKGEPGNKPVQAEYQGIP
jgi:hypothetical protein